MEKVKTIQTEKEVVMSKLLPFVITISIATLYVIITNLTPELSFTQGSWFGYRAANTLKALAVVTPTVAPAMFLASIYNSGFTGAMATGIYWLMPFANLGMAYLVYKLAQKGAMEGTAYHVKNIALLVLYAVVIAFLVRMNHTIVKFPVLFAPEAQGFLWAGMIGKIASGIIGVVTGYPLVIAWNSAKAHLRK